MSLDPSGPVPAYRRRLSLARERLAAAGLDALLVTTPSNLRYLTGLDASSGALLLTSTSSQLVVDGRYVTSARMRAASGEVGDLDVVLATASIEEAVARGARAGQGIRVLGVEGDHLTANRLKRLANILTQGGGLGAAAPRVETTERLIESLRVVKDDSEIATVREAARRLSTVAATVMGSIRPGRSELAVAEEIDRAIRAGGFSRPAFETIVASGPNSAFPHARPGDRVLEPGDGVLLDFGGVHDGYCVDLTRTVQLPPPTDGYGTLFDAVRAARDAALAAIRPGIPASVVDAAARGVLEERGFGEAFLHGTGHGLGLDVHEDPRIGKPGGAAPDYTLVPGMVFTIEPGAYVAGLGGVRIEDDVLVTEQGCEVLTDVPIDRTGRANPTGE